MYLPKHFEQPDAAAVQALIAASPLATLVAMTAQGLTADLLPLEFVPAGDGSSSSGQHHPHDRLRGHIARANPLWRDAAAEHEVLAIFTGPQAYISPNGYPSKREHGKVVPTWNYIVVQARGALTVVDDADWLRALVTGLTDRHESRSAVPWKVSDAPDDYIAQMLKAIIGIEIRITSLTAKWKVSQNRSSADRLGTAAGLLAQPGDDAQAMAALVGAAPGG